MKTLRAHTAAALATALILNQAIQAATFTWTGASGNWSDSTHWVGGNIPINDPATAVTLAGTDPINQVYTVDASRPSLLVNSVTFTSVPAQLNIAPGTALEFAGNSPFIQQPVNIATTINGSVILDSIVDVRSGTVPLTFTGPISGAGGLRFKTAGTLTLSGTSSFAGGVTLDSATWYQSLLVMQPQALGVGPVIVNSVQSDIQVQTQPGNVTDFAHSLVLNGTNTFLYFVAIGATSSHAIIIPSLGVSGNSVLAVAPAPGTTPDIAWNVSAVQLAGTLRLAAVNLASDGILGNTQYHGTITLGPVQETSPSALVVDRLMTIHLTGAGNYSGGTSMASDSVFAEVPAALGAGPVNNSAGTLTLNATNAAGNTITGGYTQYNANGAAGGHTLTLTDITIGPAVTSISNGIASDQFVNLIALRASGPMLATFDRGVGSGTTANVTFGPQGIVENTDGGLPAVLNLGANADLTLGLTPQNDLSVTLGAGTPWGGLNAQGYHGTITAAGDIALSGMFSGGTDSSFQILAAGTPVNATFGGTLNASLANYSGVAKFKLTTNTTLAVDNALGGASGTTPVPLELSALANLSIASSAAINGPALLHGNSTLTIQCPGLTGSGMLSRDAAPITLNLANAAALSGTQLTPAFIHAGDTVQLSVNNIPNLDALDPAVTYRIPGGTVLLSGAINLNGGGISLVGYPDPHVALQPAANSDLVLEVGSLGATLSSTYLGRISARFYANGNVTLAPSDPARPNLSHESITLDNPANQFLGAINVGNTTLAIASPAAVSGAAINMSAGQIAFAASATHYDNPITFSGNAAIVSPSLAGLPTGPVTLSNVSVGAAKLTFDVTLVDPVAISALTITANATLSSQYPIITIAALQQDGTTPRSLTFTPWPSTIAGPAFHYILAGQVSSTGAITVSDNTIVDGTLTSAASPLSVINSAKLAGSGTIHRPVVFPGFPTSLTPGGLSPGSMKDSTTTLPGTMTVDSLTLASQTGLTWDLGQPGIIGGSANDLVAVLGNLTVAGSLAITRGPGFAPGRYTLFTYAGGLTKNTLSLPPLTGYSLALDYSTPGQVALNVSGNIVPATWNGAAANWSDTAQWSGTTSCPNNNTASGTFYNVTINAGTPNLNYNYSVFNLTLSGGTLTGNANLTLWNGTINGAYNLTGATTVFGTLTFAAGVHNAGSFAGPGTLAVNAGATLTSDVLNTTGLTIAGTHIIRPSNNPGTSRITTLSLAGAPGAWTGKFDLTTNNMIITNGSNIPNQIKQGANLGAWNGAGGITSSSAQAAASTSTGTALACASGTEYSAGSGQSSFAGQPFNPTDTLIMYTLAGDATMDGSVTFADFLALQNNYNKPGDWAQGDWNYDGQVTFADFLIMQNNYNKVLSVGSLSPQSAVLGTRSATAPEPASLLLLAVAAPCLLRRRRNLIANS